VTDALSSFGILSLLEEVNGYICLLTGYIGCYDVISTGNEQKTSDDMTVTGCREICYALKTTLYKYKYAALKGTECHCFGFFQTNIL